MIIRNFTTALIFCSVTALAQAPAQQSNFCGSEVPSQQWEAAFQKLISEQTSGTANRANPALYTIPVIIHVIHPNRPVGQYPNLTQAQLVSQVQVLNMDFGGIGYNSSSYNPQAFANWAANNSVSASSLDAFGRVNIANCGVQFCLATKDPNGNLLAEPGIERIDLIARGWSNPANVTSYASFKSLIDNTIKAQTIWDVTKYLNIWVTDENLNAVGLLGYATFPPVSGLSGIPSGIGTASTDGFWCYAMAFGSSAIAPPPGGIYNSGNDRGRICTHEIGHYLGLRHIWGDGNCANDYCADTPPATGQNFNSPTYPYKTSGCAGNSPDGEMFMNFMDYTSDASKYMFTEDQALRIQTAMANSPYRKLLGTHNLCTVQEIPAVSIFNVPQTVCGTSAAITVSNQTTGVPVPSFTWNISGGALINPNVNSQIALISFPSSGIYTITLAADNGTLSTSSKTINVIVPVLNITGADPVECEGKDIVLTASGSNYYSWSPGTIVSPTVGFTASGVVEYTCLAVGQGNCKTTSVITISAMDCTAMSELAKDGRAFMLQPNPASSSVLVSLPGTNGTVKVTDISGKTIATYVCQQGIREQQINIEDLSKGIYFVQWTGDGQGVQAIKLIKE